MVQQELLTFIRTQLQKGVGEADIRAALLQAGWEQQDVADSFSAASGNAEQQQQSAAVAIQPVQPVVQPQMMPTISPVQPLAQQPVDMFAVQNTNQAMDHGIAMDMNVQPVAHTQPSTLFEQSMMTAPASDTLSPLHSAQTPSGSLPYAPIMDVQQPGSPVFSGNPNTMSAGMPMQSDVSAQDMGVMPNGVVVSPLKPVMKEGMSTRTKILVFSLIGFVIAAALGIGAYLYYQYLHSPDRLWKSTITQLAELRSAAFSMTLTSETASQRTTQEYIGVFDKKDDAVNAEVQYVVSQGPTKNNTLTKRFDVTVRMVNDEMYTRIALVPQSMNALRNEWLVDVAVSDDAVLTVPEFTSLTATLTQHSPLTITADLGTESVEQIEMHKYAAELNVQAATDVSRQFLTGLGFDAAQTTLPTQPTVRVWTEKANNQLRMVSFTWDHNGTQKTTVIKLWNHNQTVNIAKPDPVKEVNALGALLGGGSLDTTPDAGNSTNTNTNNNTNANINTNSGVINSNSNTNATANTNTSTNANTNAAVNSNTNTAVNNNTNTRQMDPNADFDSDGLTTVEEAQYGTDPLDPDSDDDTFLDGEEVSNGYNPKGPGKLPLN